ncbi:hypothetical protein H2203_007382 [Taxawa tesnikishii (nom. ined.)]|nr:hypothetical protein H2203_007382 [Dothideales sp. JES 119]
MARTVAPIKRDKKAPSTAKSNPPAPFTSAPHSLTSFLETLDRSHRIFTVPVILNLSIALLILWRLYSIGPTYLAIIASMLGHESPATVDKAAFTTKQLVWIVLKRTAMFAFDFVLLRFIGPWPVTFFLEKPGNPILWRWKVGFRDLEIVVRTSRSWGTEDLMQGVKTGGESAFFKVRILPAVDRGFVRSKTGYLMMDKDWDLDFAAMVKAHQLADEGKVGLKEMEKSVLAWSEKDGEWLIWQLWKMDEGEGEEEARKKIVALKDRLTVMGKESLFFRWIEIVQYESSQGEFTPERQKKTLEEVQKAFREQGVEFEDVIESVGGLEGMPGFKD